MLAQQSRLTAPLAPYPVYRDSGLAWLGKVPAHWDVRRAKHVFRRIVGGSTPSSTEPRYWGGVHVWVTPADVSKSPRIRSSLRRLTHEGLLSCSAQLLPAGSVVVTSRAPVGNVALAEVPFCTNQGCKALIPDEDEIDSLFGFNLLQVLQSELQNLAKGTTFTEVSGSILGALRLPVPPLSEQVAIVRFLDHVDRRMRRYIRVKQKLIALLEEQTHALIHAAVTGKIDVRTGLPYPAYQYSGVEWLGNVPADWAVRKLGRLGRLFKGGGGTKDQNREDGVPCIRYGDLYTHHRFFIAASRACVAPELAAEVYTPIQHGDVLFAGSGETIDEIGRSAVNLIRGPVCCGGDVIVFRPSIGADARFLGYAMDCSAAARQKACMGRGFTIVHIYSSDLKYLTVAIPGLSEQSAIVNFLDDKTRDLSAAVAATRDQVDRVREYCTRLIADVVTGKFDVRELAEGLSEVPPLVAESD